MKRCQVSPDSAIAIAYVRVSTAQQELGPEAQRAAIEAWAATQGIAITQWCLDIGISGGAPLDERPALQDALRAIAEHHAGVLVVAKRDRLARDVINAAMIERLAQRSGAVVRSAAGEGDATDPNDPTSQLMRHIIDSFAEYDRAIIRCRTKSALEVKKRRGERIGTIPFGYRVGADDKLEKNELEQATIAKAREMRDLGASFDEITQTLARSGVLGRTGRPLQRTSIVRMLSQS
jgi:DNA invertase Pin-like site-specific DNA recombinase